MVRAPGTPARGSPRELTRQAPKLDQLQPERFEPGDHAVQRGLVREATRQQRVLAVGVNGQGHEGAPHPRPQPARAGPSGPEPGPGVVVDFERFLRRALGLG
ncbi:MAG TPA: hypothetical protein VJ254_05220, partial [Streptosporangiaceae bacterium]|nr:hypothetical protein [Streptosporangiaceae bacterium]